MHHINYSRAKKLGPEEKNIRQSERKKMCIWFKGVWKIKWRQLPLYISQTHTDPSEITSGNAVNKIFFSLCHMGILLCSCMWEKKESLAKLAFASLNIMVCCPCTMKPSPFRCVTTLSHAAPRWAGHSVAAHRAEWLLTTSVAERGGEAAETWEAEQTMLVTPGGRQRKQSKKGNKQANPAQGWAAPRTKAPIQNNL